MYNYIVLNDKPFIVDDPQPPKDAEIGSGIQRTLNGNAKKDIIRPSVKTWSYNFILNNISLIRLSAIYDGHSEITLKDHFGNVYTVLCSSDWVPSYEGNEDDKEIYTINLTFEQV